MAAAVQFCSFYVGDLFLGVELMRVQEVNRLQDVTPVPLAAGVVSGLINLRGQIVTAVDLRTPAHDDDRHPVGQQLPPQVTTVVERLMAMSYEERAANPCIGRERADLVLDSDAAQG